MSMRVYYSLVRTCSIRADPSLNTHTHTHVHAQKPPQCPTLPATAWLIVRIPVLYGEITDVAESSITALVTDVLAQTTTKKIDDWAARFPTHTADVAEVVRRVVVKAAGGGGGEGGFLSGVQHFTSKERDPEEARPYTKYKICKLIGEIMNKPTTHLAPDQNPPAGGAGRPKDCESTRSGRTQGERVCRVMEVLTNLYTPSHV